MTPVVLSSASTLTGTGGNIYADGHSYQELVLSAVDEGTAAPITADISSALLLINDVTNRTHPFVKGLAPGQFLTQFSTDTPGAYILSVRYREHDMRNIGIVQQADISVDAKFSHLWIEGVANTVIKPGTDVPLTLNLMSPNGYPYTKVGASDIKITCSGGGTVSDIVNAGNGIYKTTLSTKAVAADQGYITVNATVAGTHLQPLTVLMNRELQVMSLKKSTVGYSYYNSMLTLTLNLRDSDGAPCSKQTFGDITFSFGALNSPPQHTGLKVDDATWYIDIPYEKLPHRFDQYLIITGITSKPIYIPYNGGNGKFNLEGHKL